MNKRALIIDDEMKSREVLKTLIEHFCTGVEILAVADDIDTGIEAIEAYQPDLVFLDISLKTGDSFNIISRVKKLDFCSIFVTAYNEVSVPLLQYCNIPLLLKPIDLDQLQNTILELENQFWVALFEQKNMALRHLLQPEINDIPVISFEKTHFIPKKEIEVVVKEQNGSMVYTNNYGNVKSIHLPANFSTVIKGHLLFNNQMFVRDELEYTLSETSIKFRSGKTISIE